uniref:Uncharacterized protein n=1 Tax=Romanomermis culicivorax TaxID=13658 RepID=A0A915K142_ROMCU
MQETLNAFKLDEFKEGCWPEHCQWRLQMLMIRWFCDLQPCHTSPRGAAFLLLDFDLFQKCELQKMQKMGKTKQAAPRGSAR